jgi:GNAT superfamily N-acetyltransferase
MMTESSMAGLTIRAAVADDAPTILRFIHELAAFEGRADTCTVTEPALSNALFGTRPSLEAIVAEHDGEPIGFALIFGYFSPNVGVPATFMELLYVVPEQRGRGTGRALLRRVARIAVERGSDRLEWGVDKANAPAIGFYTRLGAAIVDDILACRLDGDALRQVAEASPVR